MQRKCADAQDSCSREQMYPMAEANGSGSEANTEFEVFKKQQRQRHQRCV